VPQTRELRSKRFDVRAALNADTFLAYLGVGLSADMGLVSVGPGTLAVGAGFEYDFCGAVCWDFSASTPLDFGQRHVSLQGRASYHLGFERAKNLDFYPFVGVGPIFARSEVTVENGLARYVGTNTGLGVNFGAGVNLFVFGPVFVGGEARIRWGAGDYDYRLESGDGSIAFDRASVSSWTLAGLDVLFAAGVRLP
jgi:hypothetical protein